MRRLNQRFFNADGSNEPLEHLDIRLGLAVHKELAKTEFSEEHGSFWWGLKFGRPLSGQARDIARQLGRMAQQYYATRQRKQKEFQEGNVTLDLVPAEKAMSKAFVSGYRVDEDSGGMLGEIYPTSIRLALEEKIAKTAEIAKTFNYWVLILVDFIMGEMVDTNQIGELNLELGHFNGLVILGLAGSFLHWPDNSLESAPLARHTS